MSFLYSLQNLNLYIKFKVEKTLHRCAACHPYTYFSSLTFLWCHYIKGWFSINCMQARSFCVLDDLMRLHDHVDQMLKWYLHGNKQTPNSAWSLEGYLIIFSWTSKNGALSHL
jgi:hypothetical protein